MISAGEALAKLQQGNRRFIAGTRRGDTFADRLREGNAPQEQAPFAIILGCSDARVPAEIVFDQGLGDLFVIRVAGNIVAPSQIGSIEFAVDKFATPLVVVLGHSRCGAVIATLEDLAHPNPVQSSNLLSIVNRIRPTLEPLYKTELRRDPARLQAASIRANILASTNQLRHGSPMLESLIQQDRLSIVGAEYSLESGRVDFFEDI